jgi:hypothetical protein
LANLDNLYLNSVLRIKKVKRASDEGSGGGGTF